MIGFYNYTVILTYIGMISGFVGILSVFNGNLKMALICLLVAGLCDMFDGKIASTMKRTKSEKRFGIQIDSLSDLICFGVLPALIIFSCSKGSLPMFICAGYVLCALIRLAWFNVDEEQRQDSENGSRENYLGLPVTSSAILIPLFLGTLLTFHLVLDYSYWFLLLIALAFITPFPLKKPHTLGKILLILIGIVTLVVVVMGCRFL